MNTKADTTERQAMPRDTDQSEDLRIVEAATQGEKLREIAERWSTMADKTGACIDLPNCRLIGNGILSMLNKEKAQAEEIERLRAALEWVPHVQPETMSAANAYGAKVEMTWPEFNSMRAALGLSPLYAKRGPHARAALSTTKGAGE